MPHIVIEYSSNNIEPAQIKTLFKACFDRCCEFDCVNPIALKFRAIPITLAHYGNGSDCFIHARGHFLAGRSDERKADITKAILTSIQESLPHIDTISVELIEMDPNAYQKNK